VRDRFQNSTRVFGSRFSKSNVKIQIFVRFKILIALFFRHQAPKECAEAADDATCSHIWWRGCYWSRQHGECKKWSLWQDLKMMRGFEDESVAGLEDESVAGFEETSVAGLRSSGIVASVGNGPATHSSSTSTDDKCSGLDKQKECADAGCFWDPNSSDCVTRVR
jgi:hypothetical protein